MQQRPNLWDKHNKNYSHKLVAANHWEEIAEIIGSTSEITKKKWKHLRDNMNKELKKIPKPSSGSGGEYVAEYNGTSPYFQNLLFLRPVLITTPTEGNVFQWIELPDDILTVLPKH